MHLEKQLIYHKTDFERQIAGLKIENDKLKEAIVQLEKDIEAKERLSRVQVVEVKRLQQTCKDLSEGNKKLQLASEFYSNIQDPMTLHPQPPKNVSVKKSSNVRANRLGGSADSSVMSTGGGSITKLAYKNPSVAEEESYASDFSS